MFILMYIVCVVIYLMYVLLDTVKGSFEQNGPITNFNNKATITWATAKTIAVTSEFNTAGTFKVSKLCILW